MTQAPPEPQPTAKTCNPLKRIINILLLLAILLPVAYYGTLFFSQRGMIFPGQHRLPNTAMEPPAYLGAEVIWLETEAGPVEAWLIPGKNRSAENPGPAVLYAHGNFEFIQICYHHADWYASQGITVLLIEYRGFGRSAGSPSEKAIRQDGVAFYDILAARPEVNPTRIAFHGRSLGGGVVCAIARDRKPAALIIESSFTSIRTIAAQLFAPGFLLWHPFDSDQVITAFEGPILLGHGTDDPIIPYDHALTNAASNSNATLITYEGIGHELDPIHPQWHQEIITFLTDLGWIETPTP
ncbi:alpha/beta hydrolase [Mucisphaera sp.]|uniref:alpha/beta hydrolase n=1 Tax=Mucisphaera sp. TaxID=2913024 RepID=UPI003D0E0351